MNGLGASVGWGLAVGGSLVLGSLVGVGVRVPGRVAAGITAFGGGVLLAAVALELVPEADARAGLGWTAGGLMTGMLAYVLADAWLTRNEEMRTVRRMGHALTAGRPMTTSVNAMEATRGKAIAAGLFLDGVPESIALGLTIAEGEIGLALLVGILLGNVVEAYGAAQPMVEGGLSKRFAVGLMSAIGVALVGATVLGGTVLADADPTIVGTAQAVASGAVLAVVSVAIIPHVFAEVSRWVAVTSVFGFVAGYLLTWESSGS
jgi:ZIP family zinc transporter